MGNSGKIKLITYIDRVNILSGIFIDYYLKFFKPEEFYFLVLDTEYTPISEYILSKGFQPQTLKKVSNKSFGKANEIIVVQNDITNKFINDGFIVVYVDIDEILYHHDLRNYILNKIMDYITPTGIVIIPNSNENDLNKNDKVLNQRKHCVYDNVYHSKTCVLNKPYTWSGGRHNKNTNKISDDIFLIDIGRSCKKMILENNQKTNQIYKNVSTKYSTENKNDVEGMVSKFLPGLKFLPEYILNTKLF